jgi:hypothetical protein
VAFPSTQESLEELKKLYPIPAVPAVPPAQKYSAEEIDLAGSVLLDEIVRAIERFIPEDKTNIIGGVALGERRFPISPPEKHRGPGQGSRIVWIRLYLSAPAKGDINRSYDLWLPDDAATEDIQIVSEDGSDTFSSSLDEFYPTMSGVLGLRINMFAERVMRDMFAQLLRTAVENAKEDQERSSAET